MSFVETRINEIIGAVLYDTAGGPLFSTDVVVVQSGFEKRNINWNEGRGRWELGERRLTRAELQAVIDFYRAMRGRAFGFRFKDWADYAVTTAEGVLDLGVGTGKPTYQLYREYVEDTATDRRKIVKPVDPITVYLNASPEAGASVDYTTGIVTMPAFATRTITAITQANPGQVTTSAAHGFSTGNLIYITGVGGMTQVNNLVFTITNVDSTHFTLGVDTTNYGTYTSGGTAAKYPQPADALTWAGEFDVPVRFDTDQLRTRFDAWREADEEALHYLFSLPIVELRL
jgi:uncharacterized protein (TIGR02217 family)